ncbi:unnamed protein product [Ixodes pacificus]
MHLYVCSSIVPLRPWVFTTILLSWWYFRYRKCTYIHVTATMQIFVPVLLLAIAAVAYGRVAEPVTAPEEGELTLLFNTHEIVKDRL